MSIVKVKTLGNEKIRNSYSFLLNLEVKPQWTELMSGLWDTVNIMELNAKFYEYVLLYIFLVRGFMTYIVKEVFFFPDENVSFFFLLI